MAALDAQTVNILPDSGLSVGTCRMLNGNVQTVNSTASGRVPYRTSVRILAKMREFRKRKPERAAAMFKVKRHYAPPLVSSARLKPAVSAWRFV